LAFLIKKAEPSNAKKREREAGLIFTIGVGKGERVALKNTDGLPYLINYNYYTKINFINIIYLFNIFE
jgi:hypothetical protein